MNFFLRREIKISGLADYRLWTKFYETYIVPPEIYHEIGSIKFFLTPIGAEL